MNSSSHSRPPPKPVALFAAHAVALTLLIGFWPTPRNAYPALFHAQANGLLALAGSEVRLAPPASESGVGTDTWMRGAPGPGGTPRWTSWFSVRRIGWWPTAALVAMLLATPLTPGRRALALVAGVALVDAFTLGRVGVEIAYASYEWSHGPGGPARDALHLLLRVGSESLTATIPSVAIVLVAWVAAARPRRAIALGAPRGWRPERVRASRGS